MSFKAGTKRKTKGLVIQYSNWLFNQVYCAIDKHIMDTRMTGSISKLFGFILLITTATPSFADAEQVETDNQITSESSLESTATDASAADIEDPEATAKVLAADSKSNFTDIKLDGILNKANNALTDLNGSNDKYNLDIGQVTLSYTDVDIPVAGGMRLQLTRSYTSGYYPNEPFYDKRDGRASTDQFWQFHAGYISAPRVGQRDKKYNPFFVAADGSKIELLADPNNKSHYTTKEHWQVERPDGNFKLTSPEGIVYEFNLNFGTGIDQIGSRYPIDRYYLTKKSDQYGNFIRYEYFRNFVTKIVSSDNKELVIQWHQPLRTFWRSEHNKAQLPLKVTFNGQELVNYSFVRKKDYGMHRLLLSEVNFADGRQFKYGYKNVDVGRHGRHCPDINMFGLNEIINPDGSIIRYDYTLDEDRFVINNCHAPYRLTKKKIIDREGHHYTWTLQNASVVEDDGERYLVRDVVGPEFTTEYYFGFRNKDGQVWKMGQLLKKRIYKSHSTIDSEILQEEQFSWDNVKVSDQHETVGEWYKHRQADSATYAPQLSKYTLIRDGNLYTTSYSKYDDYGNPGHIVEEHGALSRALDVTYDIKAESNIIHLPQDIKVNGKHYANYKYNDHGKVVEQDILGVTSKYTYDQLGQLRSETNGLGQTTTYENYQSGIAKKITDPLGVVTTQVVNYDGTIATATDGRGNSTNYLYDLFQRPVEETPAVGARTATTYSSTLTTTQTHGEHVVYTVNNYSGNELQTKQRQANEVIYTQSSFDGYGREVFHSYPHHAGDDETLGIYTSYDSLGRKISECAPKASQYCSKYRYLANDTSEIERPNAAVTVQKYWSISSPEELKIAKVTEPEGTTTLAFYDELGRTTQITQGLLTRSFTYDAHGYLATEEHPEFGSIIYQRDLVGNVLKKTYQRSGNSISYTYDDNNRLRTKTTDKSITNYHYDDNGNVTQLINTYQDNNKAKSIWNYSYDADNKLHAESIQVAGKAELTWTYSYDELRNLSVHTYPSGGAAYYAPDAFGRPTKLSNFLSKFIYTPTGQLESATYSTGGQLVINYNERQLPTSLHSPASNNNYHYDEVANTTAITDLLHPEYSLSMAYDQQDRLVRADGPWGNGSFAYDANNNLIKQQFGNNIKSYQFDNGLINKISLQDDSSAKSIRPSYDLQANIIARGYDAGDKLSFDAENQLFHYQDSTNDIAYYYDGNGNLILTTKNGESRITIHNKTGKLIYERDLSNDKAINYYYLDDRLAASSESGASKVTLYYWDIAGNVVAATDTDTNNKLLWQKFYFPFGEEFTQVDSATTKLGFSTKEFDSDTGLSYFGARHYDPVLSRFLSIDPAEASVDNPISFNRYIYANNNPYKYKDPDGREAEYILPMMAAGAAALSAPISLTTAGIIAGAAVIGKGIYELGNFVYNEIHDSDGSNSPPGSNQNGNSQRPGNDKHSDNIPTASEIHRKSAGHIFRDEAGHFSRDTAANRKQLIDTAANRRNYVGTDKFGNNWHSRSMDNGRQLWMSSRNGVIRNGGINNTPRSFHPRTGMSKLIK